MQRGFFDRGVRQVAEDLLGAVIEHRTQPGLVAIRLTEVEAYDGPNDPGSHAYRGRTQRNAVMFGPPGHVYVYFTYGMHWCMNLVCGPDGRAGAVLLRAGEVIEGHDLAWSRRQAAKRERDLARGPARLTSALGVDRSCDGADACAESSALRVLDAATPGCEGSGGFADSPNASGGPGTAGTDTTATGDTIGRGPRVGLSAAAERPWRYWVDGDPTVSVYRPHTPKKRTGGRGPANDRKASS